MTNGTRLAAGVLVASVLATAACSSQSAPPTAPSAVAQNGSAGLHTPNPCDHDTLAPTIANASVSPGTLWPPNHKWWTVQVSYTTSDNCSAVTSSLLVDSD